MAKFASKDEKTFNPIQEKLLGGLVRPVPVAPLAALAPLEGVGSRESGVGKGLAPLAEGVSLAPLAEEVGGESLAEGVGGESLAEEVALASLAEGEEKREVGGETEEEREPRRSRGETGGRGRETRGEKSNPGEEGDASRQATVMKSSNHVEPNQPALTVPATTAEARASAFTRTPDVRLSGERVESSALAEERLTRTLRCLMTPEDEQRYKDLAMRLSHALVAPPSLRGRDRGELQSQVSLSHLVRACLEFLMRIEPELFRELQDAQLARPNNDRRAIAAFEAKLTEIIERACR